MRTTLQVVRRAALLEESHRTLLAATFQSGADHPVGELAIECGTRVRDEDSVASRAHDVGGRDDVLVHQPQERISLLEGDRVAGITGPIGSLTGCLRH